MWCVRGESFLQPGRGPCPVSMRGLPDHGLEEAGFPLEDNPLLLLLLQCLQTPRGFSVLSSKPSAKPGKASTSLSFHGTEPAPGAYCSPKDSLKNGRQVRQPKYHPVLSFENRSPLCRDGYGSQQRLCIVSCL